MPTRGRSARRLSRGPRGPGRGGGRVHGLCPSCSSNPQGTRRGRVCPETLRCVLSPHSSESPAFPKPEWRGWGVWSVGLREPVSRPSYTEPVCPGSPQLPLLLSRLGPESSAPGELGTARGQCLLADKVLGGHPTDACPQHCFFPWPGVGQQRARCRPATPTGHCQNVTFPGPLFSSWCGWCRTLPCDRGSPTPPPPSRKGRLGVSSPQALGPLPCDGCPMAPQTPVPTPRRGLWVSHRWPHLSKVRPLPSGPTGRVRSA